MAPYSNATLEGNETFLGGKFFQSYFGCVPKALQTLAAATQIIADDACILPVVGDGGAVTLTGTPAFIHRGEGQIIILLGTSDVNTVTIQDEGVFPGSGVDLGGANITLGARDVLALLYDEVNEIWIRLFSTNN